MGLLIECIVAVPCLAIYLGIEGTIGIEGEISVGTLKSKLIIIGSQLGLYLGSSYLATSLRQEVLRSEGASRLAVLPGMAEVFLLEGARTDNIVEDTIDKAASGAR